MPLLDLGFHQVRVRIHGMMARIEVEPGEFSKVLENREKITKEFKTYGFTYVNGSDRLPDRKHERNIGRVI